MPTLPRLSLEHAPSPDDLRLVLEGLRAFNAEQLGEAHRASYAVFLREADDAIVGGVVAEVRWRWMHVDLLWVADSHRGRGHGSALLAAAEAEARRLGCIGAHLETGAFQARPFYERHGYTVFGTLEGFPVGSRMYYLEKRLGTRDSGLGTGDSGLGTGDWGLGTGDSGVERPPGRQ